MGGDKPLRVFISYARKDAADFARQLFKRLTDTGLEPSLL